MNGVDRYSDWYGFDTENDQNGVVTLAALIHESGERWVWRRAGKFVEWCEAQTTGTPVVICHNLEYDLVNEFGDKYPYMQLNYLKGNLISAKFGRVTFLDSFNHFRMSLKKLGDSIGIKKLEMDIQSEEYVCTDAWICLKAMVMARDFFATLGGQIGATSGSSAVSIWKYMTDGEFCTGAIDTPWLRKGYYGGRTEIFRAYTEGNIRGYDINSMYPHAMIDSYPEYSMEDNKMEKLKGMAEVTISMPLDTYVPCLPHRNVEGRLTYPVGIFRGVWTYDEIRFATEVQGATVMKIHKGQGCNTLVRPFDEFIHTLYNKRKTSSSESERLMLKVVMNSLYGKIASKSTITRTVSRYNLLKKNSDRIDDVRWINENRGLLDYTTPQPDYVNLIWGSMITANSRLCLTRHMLKVPPESLIYCDTDSVYCNNTTMPTGNELGEMKLEREASIMRVEQPKAYQLDDFYKAKGVPRAKYGEDGEILIDYAKQYIEDSYTEFVLPIRFRASITSKRGKANQWVTCRRAKRTEYKHKPLVNGRYFPPVMGQPGQTDMFPDLTESTKPKREKPTKKAKATK